MKKQEKTIAAYVCEKCGKEFYDYVGESLAERTCRIHEMDCRCSNKMPLRSGTLVYAGGKNLLAINFPHKKDGIWHYMCYRMFGDGVNNVDDRLDIIEDEITGIVDEASCAATMEKISDKHTDNCLWKAGGVVGKLKIAMSGDE